MYDINIILDKLGVLLSSGLSNFYNRSSKDFSCIVRLK